MLKVRYGESLRDHLRSLLESLRARPLTEEKTLLDAFFYIAAPHAIGIPGIDTPVLAALLGLPPQQKRGRYSR